MDVEKLKKFFENKSTKIIVDTSVLLDLARYSYSTSKIILHIFNNYKGIFWIPNQVLKEYEKNRGKVFGDARKRYKNVENKLEKIIEETNTKIKKSLGNSYRYHYIKNEGFLNEINEDLNKVKTKIVESYKGNIGDDYEENINILKDIEKDLEEFVETLKKDGQVGDKINTKSILEIINEGELRYKYNISPGYKDNKKEGIDKFGDLFIWKEILNLPTIMKEINEFIFLTSDEKEDWWDREKKVNKFLFDEFKDINPNVNINFMSLKMFIKKLDIFQNCEFKDSNSNDNINFITLNKSTFDILDLLVDLNRNDAEYINRICENVSFKIIDKIENDYSTYIDLESEYVDNIEVENCYFNKIKNVYLDKDDTKYYISYELEYNVDVSCFSYDYWGRDDDTREVITSPPRSNFISGYIRILITRTINKNEIKYLKEDKEYKVDGIVDYHLIPQYRNEQSPFNCSKCGIEYSSRDQDTGGICINCCFD